MTKKISRFQLPSVRSSGSASISATTTRAVTASAPEPLLRTLGNWNLLIFFVIGVGALVFTGVPIAFALPEREGDRHAGEDQRADADDEEDQQVPVAERAQQRAWTRG
jgi:hypothetical protein